MPDLKVEEGGEVVYQGAPLTCKAGRITVQGLDAGFVR